MMPMEMEMYVDLHPLTNTTPYFPATVASMAGGREGTRGTGRERAGGNDERGRLGIDAEGGE